MSWKNVVNVVAVVLLLGPAMSASAQEPAPPPATMPMPGMVTTTNKVTAEVVQVDKTYLLVKLQSGEIRVFNVDPARVFMVDGKPLTVKQLKPGTILTATYTSTPPTGAPVATVTGKVWYVSGNMVILTLPDGTNKSYTVPPSFQFMVNGQPASVDKLRKGMKVTAHRIPEPPAVEISHDIQVTGTTKK